MVVGAQSSSSVRLKQEGGRPPKIVAVGRRELMRRTMPQVNVKRLFDWVAVAAAARDPSRIFEYSDIRIIQGEYEYEFLKSNIRIVKFVK